MTEASAPVFDFPSECPASAGMDACRAKLEAFPVAFGTERDRKPAMPGDKPPRVLIIAYQGTKDIDALHPPASPTLILHLVNHGKVKTAMYDLDPEGKADYYVTVKDENGPTWTLWRVPANNNGSITWVKGTFSRCDPPASSKWAYSIADFASCANAPHLRNLSMASMGGLSLRPLFSLFALFTSRPLDDDGGWFSCDGGCCSMSAS